MSERSTEHATFVIERTYPASPALVFNAFADPEAKTRWFVGPEDWSPDGHEIDFRVGGRERLSTGPPGGQLHTFDALYQDIVADRRIVYTYEMHLDEVRISVSLATIELEPAGDGTRLTFTEQSVFLDGADYPAQREQGTRSLLDKLDAELRREPVER
jgi:uncharacterized protein YndB with AHSA1/START domain